MMSLESLRPSLLSISFAALALTLACASDDGSDEQASQEADGTMSGDGDGDPSGDGDGDPSGDGDGDPSGDGDGDPSGDGDGDPSGDGDGDPGVDCTTLDAAACSAEANCVSVSGALYEPYMDGWCISDAVEFLGCVALENVCDYAGPACSDEFPGEVYEVDGCAPGWTPCNPPMPVLQGCGG